MASTHYNLNFHAIFATRDRQPPIEESWRNELHAYIGGVIRKLEGRALIVGGVADHVHVLASLKATHCIADIVREVKKASSVWAATHNPEFGWQTGYAAMAKHLQPLEGSRNSSPKDRRVRMSSASRDRIVEDIDLILKKLLEMH